MPTLNSMPSATGFYGPVLETMFDDVIAPAFAAAGPAGRPDLPVIRRLRSWPREVAFSIPSLSTAVAGMAIGDLPLRLLRGQLAAMLDIDLLTIDLCPGRAMVDCEVELYAARRVVQHSIAGLAMWVGASGAIAFVSEGYGAGIDFWKPAVLLTRSGLIIAETGPFVDEDDHQRGIVRATEAANHARRKVALAAANGVGRTIG